MRLQPLHEEVDLLLRYHQDGEPRGNRLPVRRHKDQKSAPLTPKKMVIKEEMLQALLENGLSNISKLTLTLQMLEHQKEELQIVEH